MINRNIYYLGLSFVIHLCFFLVIWILKAPTPPQLKEHRVLLSFIEREPETHLQPSEYRISMKGEQTASVPIPVQSIFKDLSYYSMPERIPQARPLRRSIELSVPDIPQDLLLPSSDMIIAQVLEEIKVNPNKMSENTILKDAELEWSGNERKLLKKAVLDFPEILLQEGQDVDVEAMFTVAPTGQVIEVLITQSSGYILVDRAVERALSDYLFEESTDGRRDTGKIKFLFRLERLD